MNEGRNSVNAVGRVAVLLLILCLAVTNSLFLYFVFRELLGDGQLLSSLIFSISASAHLLYLFLPWFARDLLTPIFYRSSESSRRYAGQGRVATSAPSASVGFLPSMMMVIGSGLCVAALAFWIVGTDPFGFRQEVPAPYISEANCQNVGGKIVEVDGKRRCDLGARGSQSGRDPAVAPAAANGN